MSEAFNTDNFAGKFFGWRLRFGGCFLLDKKKKKKFRILKLHNSENTQFQKQLLTKVTTFICGLTRYLVKLSMKMRLVVSAD